MRSVHTSEGSNTWPSESIARYMAAALVDRSRRLRSHVPTGAIAVDRALSDRAAAPRIGPSVHARRGVARRVETGHHSTAIRTHTRIRVEAGAAVRAERTGEDAH